RPARRVGLAARAAFVAARRAGQAERVREGVEAHAAEAGSAGVAARAAGRAELAARDGGDAVLSAEEVGDALEPLVAHVAGAALLAGRAAGPAGVAFEAVEAFFAARLVGAAGREEAAARDLDARA